MAGITISRQLGSGGADIARQVTQTLGYELVDKRTIEGIFRQYGLTRFDELYASTPGILDVIDQNNLLIVSMLNEIIEAEARRGNVVILGRGGFAVLGDCADVLNVRIVAPPAVRAQRVQAREHLQDVAAAEQRIRDDDAMRSRWVQVFYNKRWDEPANFQMVIDTGETTYEEAVQQIVAAARDLEQKASAPGAAVSSALEVDPVLADAVARVMANPLPDLTR